MDALDLHIAKLDVKSGDTLLVQCDGRLTAEAAQRIKDQVSTYVPEGVRTLVVDSGLGLSVLSTSRIGIGNKSRVAGALTAEPWAIVPAELQKIAAIVQRHSLPDAAAKGEPEYQKRDYQLMAGPGAQRLAGTNRAFLIDGVAILPITGPIFPRANMMTEYSGATSINTLTDDYRKALDSADVGAILMLLDSPGGQVSGINALADIVAAGTKKKYTTAFVAGSAASAAYWIASAASEIAMERTGMVGSIGVVAAIPVQVAPDGGGDVWIEIVSSGAPNKRPDPISEDGRSEIIAMLDAVEKQFVADVARGRRTTSEKVLSDFGRGGIKVGADAVKAGMADKVQSYDAALNALRGRLHDSLGD